MEAENETSERVEILRKATYLLVRTGFQAHQRGYRYLREAIVLVSCQPEMLDSVTKLLYPEIAKLYNTTDKQVERAIRNAIETAWISDDSELLRHLFENECNDVRPTNSAVIQKFVDNC